MRKYVCEYCGNIYDAEKNGRCPSCGGPISKQVKDQIEKEQEEQRARNARLAEDVIRRHEIETQNRKKLKPTENRMVYIHNSYNYTRNLPRSRKRGNGCLTAIVIYIILIVIGVLAVRSQIKEDTINKIQDIISPTESVDTHDEYAIADFMESITQPTYIVTCDNIREYNIAGYERQTIPDDMQIIAVHLSVKNTSRSNIQMFTCTARYTDNDGIEWTAKIHSANDRERSNRFTSTWLLPGHEYDGWVFIELPDSAASLSLKYGESCEFIITEFP